MYDSDESSFSIISTAEGETVDTPTDQGTDEFELFEDPEAEWSHLDDSSSDSTSAAPSVYYHEFEHGRRYHSYASGRYPLPNDAREQHREETKHALMLELTEGDLFLSNVGDCPQKILDIGTGSGTWAIDVADCYPSATVIGIDLSPIQPRWLPNNLNMYVEDCEEPSWIHGSNFDLVHFREVAGVLRDIDAVLAAAYSNLRNGGWVEFHELNYSILCDDGTMTNNDPVRIFGELYTQGMRSYGCQNFGRQDLKRSMERAGFKRVQLITKKVPISSWPQDEKLRTLGILMKMNLVDSLDAFAAKPLAALGMTPKERRQLVTATKQSLEDKKVHRYVNCIFCYGQKLETGSEWEMEM